MKNWTKAATTTAAIEVDAKTKRKLEKASAALSELAGAWIEAQATGRSRRRQADGWLLKS